MPNKSRPPERGWSQAAHRTHGQAWAHRIGVHGANLRPGVIPATHASGLATSDGDFATHHLVYVAANPYLSLRILFDGDPARPSKARALCSRVGNR